MIFQERNITPTMIAAKQSLKMVTVIGSHQKSCLAKDALIWYDVMDKTMYNTARSWAFGMGVTYTRKV